MVGTDANDLLQDAIMELEAFARGDLPISDYVKDVPPVRSADKTWGLGYQGYRAGMDCRWTALEGAGLSTVTPTAYNAWRAQADEAIESLQEIRDVGREELLLRLSWIQRAERFSDGYWADVLERGMVLAYARRLAEFTDR